MVNSLVERATSYKLNDPDWGINIQICDILKENPGKAKDVVESIKRQLRSKNPKVQGLAVTLLDTVLKNCADIVRTHVVQKDLHLEMANIISKKPNDHVQGNLETLILTWEEVIGSAKAINPQYEAAQREVWRAGGAAFSPNSERSLPTTVPTRTHPLTSDPQNSDFPTLSCTEIQNMHGTMDVLAEMLNALDPRNKEGLKEDVIVDLVEQCRTYKQRMIHLVNASSDEDMIRKGLALNDDLQLILAKHAAIASGTFVQVEKPKPKESLVHGRILSSTIADVTKHRDGRSSSSTSGASQPPTRLQLPAHPESNGPITHKERVAPLIDLLSGEDYTSPTAENLLAIVPVGEPQPTSPICQDNILALPDMFSETNSTTDSLNSQAYYPVEQTCFSSPQFQKQQLLASSQTVLSSNGNSTKVGLPLQEESVFTHINHANPKWNVQVFQDFNQEQQQQPYYGGGTVQSSRALPPPPWEAHPTDNNQMTATHQPQPMQVSQMVITQNQQMNSSIHLQSFGNDKVVGMVIQPITKGHLASLHSQQPFQSNQLVGIPQPVQGGQMVPMLPQPVHGGQLTSAHPETMQYNQFFGPQFLEQRMHALSVQDDNTLSYSSYQLPIYSPQKKSNPFNEDKLYGGDLGHGKVEPSDSQ